MSRGVPMSLGMEGWADPVSFAIFTLMWAVMMIAMMLPSSYPTLLMHRSVYRQRNPSRPGGTLLFASSYFVIWSATGALFYAAYVLVGHWRSTSALSNHVILRAAGVALIVAGLYQWSRLKTSCLKHCQSPLHFIMEHWRDGRGGAIRMGAEHGFYCFGCCWGLMLVLFMMGVMHLGWMAAVSAFILIEKVTPTARWIPKLAGGVMVGLGSLVAFVPDTLLALSSQVTLH
jgi:predicted metal-binding membrane protein